jgi:PAS domain S-box-containing protein
LESDGETDRLFELSRELCCMAGFDGYYKRVNESFTRAVGYSREELMSRPFVELVHPEDVRSCREALAGLARGYDMLGFQCRMICADRSVRWLEWSTRTVPDRGFAYCVGRDVTDRRRAEEQLREAQRIVEASRDELRVLAEEQAALRRVATLVAREYSPGEVCGQVAQEVGLLLGAEAVIMHRYESIQETIVVASWGKLATAFPVGARMPLDRETIAGVVRRTRRPARIDDYKKVSGSLSPRFRELGLSSAAGAPIIVDGRLWGAVSAGTFDARLMPPNSESRIGEFTELVATAISNVQAREELAASRARVVAAADDERRSVVRDLHDGAQQRLVHTVIALMLAQRALESDTGDAPALVHEALKHAEEATAELRELAHGILPSVLTRGGLRAGVAALASRMAVPVEFDVSVDRLPPPVEATAYFVVAEALTNVAKHSNANGASVTARIENGELRVQVRDDGAGGVRPDGSGLVGLADRLAAFAGRLSVDSEVGGGTSVVATIPIGPESGGPSLVSRDAEISD